MKAFREWWDKHRASKYPHTCQSSRGENLAMLADEEIWKAALEWILKIKKNGDKLAIISNDDILMAIESAIKKELENE